MSFFNKIAENKVLFIGAGLVTLLAASVGWVYRDYQRELEEEKSNALKQSEEKGVYLNSANIDIESEIRKLKQSINPNNVKLEDVKRILTLITKYIKGKTLTYSNKMRLDRRDRFPRENRNQHFVEYLRFVISALRESQNHLMVIQREQTEIFEALSISQETLRPFQKTLQANGFMKTLMATGISLEDVRKSLSYKLEYLRTSGEEMIDKILEASNHLTPQEKQLLPMTISIVINDEIFENYPSLDKEEIDMACLEYEEKIRGELMELNQLLNPLMGKMQSLMMHNQNGMMGMPEMGDNMNDDLFGQMGGLDGISQEMIQQQMEQLDQMRINDPEAFNQFMAMMQAQTGINPADLMGGANGQGFGY